MQQLETRSKRCGGTATVGSMEDEKVFVLRSVDNRFFREWIYNPHSEPSFHFVSILSCARAFPDKTMAAAFQRFLETNHEGPVEICEVERGRLLKFVDREPRWHSETA